MPKRNGILATLGLNVRRAREARELTQETLAERASLDPTNISGIERGLRNPGDQKRREACKGAWRHDFRTLQRGGRVSGKRKQVGQDSVEPKSERSEASNASISHQAKKANRPKSSIDARTARAASGGRQGSTESRPTKYLREDPPRYGTRQDEQDSQDESHPDHPVNPVGKLRFIDLFCGIGGFRLAIPLRLDRGEGWREVSMLCVPSRSEFRAPRLVRREWPGLRSGWNFVADRPQTT